MSFLTLTGVQKTFPGGTVAVEDFNLDAVRGEFVSFLGPSGCGKTTTLRMIAGFEKPTAGTIVVDGTDITYRNPNQRNVGMVFQSYALFPNMSVADNIGFGLKVRKRPKAEITKRVGELLELIHLEGRADRFPWQMSGGQQQRVALARALAIEPQVLLLDEPLSALDAKIRIVLRKEIRAIQRQLGITTVYVTHDQEEALSLSDRVVVMSDGPDRADRNAVRDLQLPEHGLRGLVRGHAQPGHGRRRRRGGGPAIDRRPAGQDEQGRDRCGAGRPGDTRACAPRGSSSAMARPGRISCAARSRTSTSSVPSSASGSRSVTARTARRRR